MTDVKEQKFASNSVSNFVRRQWKHKILKEAFADNALCLTKTYEWFKHLKERTDISRQ
jgi:hypothetical protein